MREGFQPSPDSESGGKLERLNRRADRLKEKLKDQFGIQIYLEGDDLKMKLGGLNVYPEDQENLPYIFMNYDGGEAYSVDVPLTLSSSEYQFRFDGISTGVENVLRFNLIKDGQVISARAKLKKDSQENDIDS